MFKQQIKNDTVFGLRSGDKITVETLRMLSAAITTKEKEKRYRLSKEPASAKGSGEAREEELAKKSELTDEEIIDVTFSEIKKRKDAIALYERGNRPELAEKEQKEIEVLKKYLPEQLSEEELKKLVEESIAKVGAKEIKEMGKVMADLNPKIKGKADGGQASKIVKELLSK